MRLKSVPAPPGLTSSLPAIGLLNRRLLEDFLTSVRESIFTGSTQQKNAMFEYLSSFPQQVNQSSIWVASTVTGGKTFLTKLKALEKKQKSEQEASAKRAKQVDEDTKEEEEDDEAQPSTIKKASPESEPFLAREFVDILGCNELLIWSDGELTLKTDQVANEAKRTQALTEELQKLSDACLKLDAEFAKEDWSVNVGNEVWRGFFVRCPSTSDRNAGEDFARSILNVQDQGDQLDVRVKEIADSRKTFWPQRYYYEGHVSTSKLARVKRGSNAVKAPVKKNTLCEVMFHTESRAWFWPPVILVGRSKVNPDYLIGLRYVTHDQEHLHHGQ